MGSSENTTQPFTGTTYVITYDANGNPHHTLVLVNPQEGTMSPVYDANGNAHQTAVLVDPATGDPIPPGGGTSDGGIVPITQADYDALSPPDANKLYVIIDTLPSGSGPNLEWWQGTQAAYDAIDPKDPDTLYIVKD